ncbi:hypothetical protein Poli38472_012273 [Pythium oligandrum]|uniref:Uncharacterized protein n=1 Tax=Pythium oligandrum TaxID=41045 RepID=A0A8K1FPQ9_PYTOL|nr:hypothetical protein Poli38472_012273 [Pythium oligandrum]|eukprot:TMW67157.1 hypothetical protein Poli38472_012273 [Pythium oligandrum]
MMSHAVGARILDIFILQHNLRVGERWGRLPPIGSCDFRELCQSALLCNELLPESELYAFALKIVSANLNTPPYRLSGAFEFPFKRWLRAFSNVRVSSESIQACVQMQSSRPIRDLMLQTSVSIKSVSRKAMLDSLQLTIGGGEVDQPKHTFV